LLSKCRKSQYQINYDCIPNTLDDTMFFGLTLDKDQKIFRDAIWDKEKVVVLCDSKSGSGKSLIATAVATLLVKFGYYDGIVYVMSPTQEQAQGYLPGSIEEKSAPYMQPLFDALTSIGEDPMISIKSDDNIQAQKDGRAYIDVCTDTFMRGINLEHKVVIIDEAQNFYFDQLKKVLTRIHDNSKCIVIGSSIQCDIIKHPERSGFVPYIKAFESSGSDKCQICKLTKNYRGWLSNFADAVMLKDYMV